MAAKSGNMYREEEKEKEIFPYKKIQTQTETSDDLKIEKKKIKLLPKLFALFMSFRKRNSWRLLHGASMGN